MADSLPNEDGYQEYLTLNIGESFILEPVDREEVSRIMRNQKPKLSWEWTPSTTRLSNYAMRSWGNQ